MNFGLSFTNPWALALWPCLAVYFGWLSRRTLTDLSPLRARLALGLRLIVVTLLVLALAGTQLVRHNRDLAVMFVVDYSDSVGPAAKQQAANYIQESIRGRKAGDRWGVVVFGRDAAIELAPGTAPSLDSLRSVVPGEFTDISAAIRLAAAALPDGMRRRLVVLSDGNENLGDAIAEAQNTGNNDIAIDVVPLTAPPAREVLLERMTLPNEAKIGEPLEVRVVASATNDTDATLKLFRDGKYLGEKKVRLSKGKNTFVFPQSVEQAGSSTFEALLQTERGGDTISENNKALGFVTVAGKPRVLLIDNDTQQAKFLTDALQREKVNVELRSASGLPLNLRQMQPYDSIVLNNVAAWEFTATQMLALQSYVRDLGGGLVMIGGENSYGPGGYRSTPVEETLPVTMDIRNQQYIPGGAVAMIMHSMEFANGNDWAKSVCSEVTRQLGDEDYAGLIIYGMDANWVYDMQKVGPNRNQMLTLIRGINPGDMPDFDAALEVAYGGLSKTPAYLKHVIILSDGDPSPPRDALVAKFNKARITVSTVVINPHDNSGNVNMYRIAKQHGGRFYKVTNPRQIPKIFLKEAATVSRSAIIEGAFTPRLESDSSIIKGISALPRLLGYVGTSPKTAAEGSRVVLASGEGDPILATRQYGLGKSVAWTSDARQRWSAGWLAWSGFSKFWAQTVRWSMRQTSISDLNTNVEIEKGVGRVTVEAVDEAGNFLNFLNPKARLVPPTMKGKDLSLDQTGPGRYEATFDARELGTYLLNIRTQRDGRTASQITGGVLPYSPEYRAIGANDFLLSRVADSSGGEVGLAASQIFARPRKPASVPEEIWLPLLMLATLLFPLDVALRRLTWGEEEWMKLRARLSRRTPRPPTGSKPPRISSENMERLKRTKRRSTSSDDEAGASEERRHEERSHAEIPESARNAPAGTRSPTASAPSGERIASIPAEPFSPAPPVAPREQIASPEPPSAPEAAPSEAELDPMERLRRAKRRARGEE